MKFKDVLKKPGRWWLLALVPFLLVALWIGAAFLPGGGHIIENGPDSRPVIALTFDDGPSPATADILDILQQYQAKATFFVCGANVERYPDTARRIVEEGHQIANHSQSHSEYLRFYLPHQVVNDTHRAEKAIREATGITPRFYRAPYGRTSPWMRWTLEREDLRLVGWGSESGDWENPGVEELISRIIENVHPGSIILLHDGHHLDADPDRSQLIQALPEIIRRLQAQGYELVTVAEMLDEAPYI